MAWAPRPPTRSFRFSVRKVTDVKTLAYLVLSALYILCIFRLGASLQRINDATVMIDAPICTTYALPVHESVCTMRANMAGRLDGGWAVTPLDRNVGTFYVSGENMTYSYSRNGWRLAYGGEYIVIGLLLLGALVPVIETVRLIGQSSGHKSKAG